MTERSIVLVGAGSTVFTPGLLTDLASSRTFDGWTVHLVDLDADAFAADRERLAAAAGALAADADGWVLGGGEDHGLLATFPASADVPAPFVVVGRVRDVDDEPGVLVAGRRPTARSGWDHFAG